MSKKSLNWTPEWICKVSLKVFILSPIGSPDNSIFYCYSIAEIVQQALRLEKNYECPQLRLLPVIDLFKKNLTTVSRRCVNKYWPFWIYYTFFYYLDPSGANTIELDSKPSWEYTSVYNSAYQQEESASRKNFYYYKLVSGKGELCHLNRW